MSLGGFFFLRLQKGTFLHPNDTQYKDLNIDFRGKQNSVLFSLLEVRRKEKGLETKLRKKKNRTAALKREDTATPEEFEPDLMTVFMG